MSTFAYLAEIKARLDAMKDRSIGGADARQFYQPDVSRLIAIVELQWEALDKCNIACAPSDKGHKKRNAADQVLEITFDAIAAVDAIAAGEGEK